jgi:hypothetical protein
MAATTTIHRRKTEHHSGGGEHRRRAWGAIFVCGAVFLLTWAIWTFWFASSLPR